MAVLAAAVQVVRAIVQIAVKQHAVLHVTARASHSAMVA